MHRGDFRFRTWRSFFLDLEKSNEITRFFFYRVQCVLLQLRIDTRLDLRDRGILLLVICLNKPFRTQVDKPIKVLSLNWGILYQSLKRFVTGFFKNWFLLWLNLRSHLHLIVILYALMS